MQAENKPTKTPVMDPRRVFLADVRLSFPSLFEPEVYKPGDQPKYKATFLIPKGGEVHKKLEAAAIAALEAKYPGKGLLLRKQIAGNNNKCCIQDGDLSEYEGYAGHVAVSAKNAARPRILDTDTSPLTAQDGRPYAGCYVHASIEFFAYDQQGKGLSASLRGVQFVRHGDAFCGGGIASAEEFDSLEVEGDTADLF